VPIWFECNEPFTRPMPPRSGTIFLHIKARCGSVSARARTDRPQATPSTVARVQTLARTAPPAIPAARSVVSRSSAEATTSASESP
jgi:hypothetical protein